MCVVLAAVACVATARVVSEAAGTQSEADHLATLIAEPGVQPIDDAFAPDAKIWLVGASSAISTAEFQGYVDRVKRDGNAFVATTPVVNTPGGAGWFVGIRPVEEQSNRLTPDTSTARLWIETQPATGKIERLWFHFTAADAEQHYGNLDSYVRNAQARGTPVPPGWRNGTAGVLAALGPSSRQPSNSADVDDAAALASWIPLTLAGSAGLLRTPQSPFRRSRSGALFAQLREFDAERRRLSR